MVPLTDPASGDPRVPRLPLQPMTPADSPSQTEAGSNPDPAKPHVHYPVLDGIRGLAIALVMFQHFFFHNMPGAFVGDKIVFKLADRAWMGVDLFFVLSGFLITGILWDAKSKPNYYRNFYARRVLRIFPAYYAVLVIFFLILPQFGSAPVDAYLSDSLKDQAWHWTYLSNFKIAMNAEWYQQHIPNVFWSLAVEEQFYFVWPFVVYFMGRKAILGLCAVLALFALGFRMWVAASPDYNWVQSFVLPFSRLDGLVMGAALALLFRSPMRDQESARRGFWALLVGAGLAWGIMTALQNYEGWREEPVHALRFTVIAIGGGSLLWLCMTSASRHWLVRVFQAGWLRYLGKYSYALYLWHGPADTLVRHYWHPAGKHVMGSALPAQIGFSLLAFAVALAFSLVSWHLIEKHFLRMKKSFV